jgi:hypothetical protein
VLKIKRKKPDWIGHILRRTCLLKQVIEVKMYGKEDEEDDVRVCWLILRKEKILGTERGSTTSLALSLASKLWKGLRTS